MPLNLHRHLHTYLSRSLFSSLLRYDLIWFDTDCGLSFHLMLEQQQLYFAQKCHCCYFKIVILYKSRNFLGSRSKCQHVCQQLQFPFVWDIASCRQALCPSCRIPYRICDVSGQSGCRVERSWAHGANYSSALWDAILWSAISACSGFVRSYRVRASKQQSRISQQWLVLLSNFWQLLSVYCSCTWKSSCPPWLTSSHRVTLTASYLIGHAAIPEPSADAPYD